MEYVHEFKFYHIYSVTTSLNVKDFALKGNCHKFCFIKSNSCFTTPLFFYVLRCERKTTSRKKEVLKIEITLVENMYFI